MVTSKSPFSYRMRLGLPPIVAEDRTERFTLKQKANPQIQTPRSLPSSFIPLIFLDPRTYIGKAQIIKDHSCCPPPYPALLHLPRPSPDPNHTPPPTGRIIIKFCRTTVYQSTTSIIGVPQSYLDQTGHP